MLLTATVCEAGPASHKRFLFGARHERVPAGPAYFVDFRAEAGVPTGHTYIVYGRLDTRGQLRHIQHADVYPVDGNAALVGAFAPVRGEVRVREGDSRRRAAITYRRYLSAADYARLLAAIRHEREINRQWSLLLFNCNDFARNIAEALGLRRPHSLMLPTTFVASMRVLNRR